VIFTFSPLHEASQSVIQQKERYVHRNAKEIMIEAVKGKYAVGAFNITDLLQFEAVIDAAVEKKAPLSFRLQSSPPSSWGRV